MQEPPRGGFWRFRVLVCYRQLQLQWLTVAAGLAANEFRDRQERHRVAAEPVRRWRWCAAEPLCVDHLRGCTLGVFHEVRALLSGNGGRQAGNGGQVLACCHCWGWLGADGALRSGIIGRGT